MNKAKTAIIIFALFLFILTIFIFVYFSVRQIQKKEAAEIAPIIPEESEAAKDLVEPDDILLPQTESGATGKIGSFDPVSSSLTFELDGESITFSIGESTEIFRDGTRVERSDIIPGDIISVIGRGGNVGAPEFIADTVYLSKDTDFGIVLGANKD